MADNIKVKNIKLNTNVYNDKKIFDYFYDNKDNFSKVTKALLLKYIDGDIDINGKTHDKSVIKMLKNNEMLLKQLIETGVKIENPVSESNDEKSIKEEEENFIEDNNFNIDFLNQIK